MLKFFVNIPYTNENKNISYHRSRVERASIIVVIYIVAGVTRDRTSTISLCTVVYTYLNYNLSFLLQLGTI